MFDPGIALSSTYTDLTGATVTISSATLQLGDTLIFTNQNGITGSYSGGVLTLSGSATPAQYQTALQSVTFSTASVSTTTRSISVVANNGATASNTAAEASMSIRPAQWSLRRARSTLSSRQLGCRGRCRRDRNFRTIRI